MNRDPGRQLTNRGTFGVRAIVIGSLIFSSVARVFADSRTRGLSTGEFMRAVGLTSTIIALAVLVLVEFVFRRRLQTRGYHWFLLVGLFLLPTISVVTTGVTVLEETRTVASCGSCHVMGPFVRDLTNPSSATLAARHFKNKWIANHQCYSCHTSYGVHGTLSAKRDGLRHWLLYVTNTWDEPIKYRGTYPNSNCLACHEGTPKFGESETHQALLSDLVNDQTGCVTCHGPVHPIVSERSKTTNGTK